MNVLLLKHIRASQVDTWSLPHSPNSKYYGWFTPPIFPAEDWRAMEITAFPFGIQDNLWDHSDGVAWNWNWTQKYTWGLRTVGKFRGGNVLISVYFSACPLSWPRNESHLWALFLLFPLLLSCTLFMPVTPFPCSVPPSGLACPTHFWIR